LPTDVSACSDVSGCGVTGFAESSSSMGFFLFAGFLVVDDAFGFSSTTGALG
jgi:hypothetical protein